jgi:ArsR family transcriptional regulator, lead/cadmium/zinc/bismuth-responsive transcriptional repressor
MKCIPPEEKLLDIPETQKAYTYTPEIDELSCIFQTLGSPNRLKICHLLLKYKKLCVCDLAEILSLSVPATSQHLAKLKTVGLLKTQRDAQTIYYQIKEHEQWEFLAPIVVKCETD